MKKTLNLGCGERTFETYPDKDYTCINLDARTDLPNVDINGDVRDLSQFQNETFDYVLASDIIEHFPLAITVSILTEWKRILKQDGILEIRTPNMEFCVQHYLKHKNCQHMSWMLYGNQEHDLNFHYVLFDRKWFNEICTTLGLKEVSYEEESSNMIIKLEKGV
jgi:predicted SAM-dependent methyltransferase